MMNQPEPNRLARSVLYLARFMLETKTALSIGSGGADNVFDHPIVRDANGLPQIPGSSLAGVLRHLWITDHPDTANQTADDQQEKAADGLFGFHHRDKGNASRIEVAACALQDQDGKPVEGLLLGKERQRLHDPLLAAALISRADPNFRDRVRLTHRGVAAHLGKFDRGLLPAGYRFSGELRLWSKKDDLDWEAVLALLADPRLRLGGGTRAGLGAMTLKKLHRATFDLTDASDIKQFQQLSPALGAVDGLEELKNLTPALAAGVQKLCIKLNPKDFWRIGQGDAPIGQYEKNEPTLLPKQERRVVWQENGASVRGKFSAQQVLVPGSSIKGALAHRTAFHWNVLNQKFVDDLNADQIQKWDKSEHCAGVMELFGFAKNNAELVKEGDQDNTGQAGRVIIDDVYVNISAEDVNKYVKEMVHNSIDRFTGGVRNRMLFTEELIFYRSISLTITLLPGVTEATAYQAFARALSDLCSGSLAIGGGVTKGHGAFSGEPDQATREWMTAQGVCVQ